MTIVIHLHHKGSSYFKDYVFKKIIELSCNDEYMRIFIAALASKYLGIFQIYFKKLNSSLILL